MSERVFPIGDSPQFNQNPASGAEGLNLLKITGPSGREVPVLPIQIDDPAVIQRAMNMNIYGSEGTGKLASSITGTSAGETSDALSLNDPIFDRSASSMIAHL